MSKYIDSVLGDNSILRIEIADDKLEPLGNGKVVKASSHRELAEKAQGAFSYIITTARSIAIEFGNNFGQLNNPPDEVKFAFGIKINANADIVIAKAGAESQFSVSMTWKQRASPKP